MKSLLPNSGVSCLLSAFTQLWQTRALACTEGNLSPFIACGIWHQSLPRPATTASLLCPQTHGKLLLQTLTDTQHIHRSLHLSHLFSLSKPRRFSPSGSSQDFCLQLLVGGSCNKVCKALPAVTASSLSSLTAATPNHFLFPKPFHAAPSAWNYPPPSLSDSFFKTQVQRPCLQKASPMVPPASSVGPLSQKSTCHTEQHPRVPEV